MNPNWDRDAQTNASNIKSEIDTLESGHWDMFKRDYKSFWAHSKQISQLFKNLKPIKKEDREDLWSRFSTVCEEAKNKQQSDYQNRVWKSERHKKDIMSEIASAEVVYLPGVFAPDVKELKWQGQKLKEAARMLSEHKDEMLGEHKQECFERIQQVRRSHDAWWEDLKRQRENKHEEFQARVRNNLDKNYDRLRKATDALHSCEQSADKLRDDINSAWNADWASQASGWLSELEDKIRDIERSIERIEEWIREDEEKLR